MKTGKILCILFALLMTAGLLSVGLTAFAADPAFTTVQVNGDSLKAYLEMDGNLIIDVIDDIEARIGTKGDRDSPHVDYWCTLGSGTKVLNLNGYDVTLLNDRESKVGFFYDSYFPMTMFRVPEGAEFVINDSENKGKINYGGMLKQKDGGFFSDPGDDYTFAGEVHNLISVQGGRLVVNGGKLYAGKSDKYYGVSEAKYFWRQINGYAIIMESGTTEIRGGVIQGRGYYLWELIDHERYPRRCAAIKAAGGNLTIYNGEVWGMGSADVFQLDRSVNINVVSGSFNTHKLGHDIAWVTSTSHVPFEISSSYGNVGLPGRAFRNVGTRTEVKASVLGVLTAEQVAADETLNTSHDIEVYPVEVQSGHLYQYLGDSYPELADGATVEWDKVTNLKLRFTHDQAYPHQWRPIDQITGQDYGNTYAIISEKPLGALYVAKTDPGTSETVDLNDLPQSVKDSLEVGKTYYLTMRDKESWTASFGTREILYQADTKKIKLRIVEPDLTMPDLDFSVTWENSLDSSGKNRIRLIPTGDAFWSNIDTLMNNGKISECRLTYYYQDHNNARQTYVQDTNTNSNTGSGVPFTDFYRGISTVKLMMEVWKGDSFLGSKTVSADVLCFPDITADRTVDSSNRILVSPSNTAVTLSCDANGITGLFWTKDGTDVGGYGRDTYPVNITGTDKMGWYSLGYTVGGKDYFSDQKIYLGVDGGSTKSLKLSASAASCTLRADGDAMPDLTAVASGSGLGTIKEYQWQNVSWPEGARPSAKRYSTTKYTVSIADVFGCKGYETQQFAEGMYVFSCTAYDSYDQPVTSNTVSVYVYRPAQGLQLWHDSVTDSWHEIPYTGGEHQNVTDKFIVLYNEDDTDYLSAVFTPQNATTSSVAFNAMSDAVTVDKSGRIQARSAGSATITATTGTGLSASTKVIVPKTRYDITIPEAWLKVEAGATVHRGTVPTTYADYTVELNWEARGSSDWYDYNDATFAGNRLYLPVVTIRPKAGVYFPVNVEYRGSNSFMYFADDNDRYVITVNGVEYFGVDYCGQQRSYYYDSEPVSKGGTDDFLKLNLTPTEKIIDWRDEYISRAVFILDVPSDGDPRDMTPEDELTLLNCTVLTDGVIVSNAVKHVTDLSTIKDTNISNDKLEDFETYKEGETYRASLWLMIDSSYKTSLGGKAYFADQATAVEPELGALTGERYSSYIMGYVYFTATEKEEIHEHTIQKVSATASTCIKQGTKEHYACKDCGMKFSDAAGTKPITDPSSILLPLGDHTWDAGVVTKEPTTTATGVMTYTCQRCGATKTETIPKLSSVKIGDVNQDGSVDATDRMILSRYLAKWDGYAAKIKSMDAADIDRNGKVEAKDRMILARYLAKWDGYSQYFK